MSNINGIKIIIKLKKQLKNNDIIFSIISKLKNIEIKKEI